MANDCLISFTEPEFEQADVVTGSVGWVGCPLPAGTTNHSGLHSPNRRMFHAAWLKCNHDRVVVDSKRCVKCVKRGFCATESGPRKDEPGL